MGWALATPILLLIIYGLVFGIIFPVRFPMTDDAEGAGTLHFAMILFSGLLVHGMMAEILTRTPSSVLAQPNLVKKVVFPLELLPLVPVISALFHCVIGFAILLAAMVIVKGVVPLAVLWLPILLVIYMCYGAAAAWLLGSLGVYLRDIGQITALLTTALLFLSPVFYPLSVVPEGWRDVMMLNPLTPMIETVRYALFHHAIPPIHWLIIHGAGAVMAVLAAFWWFGRVRKGFADVL